MAALHEIDKAIGAHTVLKLRLKSAIDSGRVDEPITGVHAEGCPFGKWLHGPTIAPATRGSAHYARVRELHTRFHQHASRVVELAATGATDEAVEEITGAGEFSKAHRELAAAMNDWKTALK